MNKFKSFLKGLLIFLFSLIFAYVLFIFLIYFNQQELIYHPDHTNFKACDTFSPKEMKTYKDTNFYERKGETNDLIIFFHGNSGRACDRKNYLKLFEKTKHNIIFMEYAGYGDVKYSPSKKNILKNVEEMIEYISKKKYNKIYVVGRSLGTGPASYFAQKYKADKLILISPYDSISSLAKEKFPFVPVDYLLTENYTPIKYLENFKNPVLIIHGKKDELIPYSHMMNLANKLKNKKIILLENASHNDIFNQKTQKAILDFIRNKKG